MLSLYNTLTRKKEIFKPITKKTAGLYSCGPTVYWYQHIGNLRAYIFSDVLKRVLSYNGYAVQHVINITDVGHLTSDADEGEDKMEKAAKKEGRSAQEIANRYFSVFQEDLHKLNITDPDIWCKATEHINEQLELIKKLEEKGFTYVIKDGVYFDTSKLKNYGELARLKKEGLKAGARVEMGEKKSPTDFALWKFSEKPGVRQQEWPSPWGVGFPGWHIECSAMSIKYLGEHFDIHTGGEDHVSIHHTNEIAQSEAATGKKFVNYWLHGAFLTFKGDKVSKSKGGLFTLSELEEKGFHPLAYRYLCLGAHYRKPLDFSLEALKGAENSLERLKNICDKLPRNETAATTKKYLNKFYKAINDDLNMPEALAALWEMLRDEKSENKYTAVAEMDKVFGLDLLKSEKTKIPGEIQKLADERETARAAKDFKKSDELRKKIESLGWTIKDTPNGADLKK